LIIIEILPVLIDNTAILESVPRIPILLAIHKNLVILESFNLITKEIILTRVLQILQILHLVAITFASYLYIILFKVDAIGFLAVDREISVHFASFGYVFFITI
jgi:hypothetical protein